MRTRQALSCQVPVRFPTAARGGVSVDGVWDWGFDDAPHFTLTFHRPGFEHSDTSEGVPKGWDPRVWRRASRCVLGSTRCARRDRRPSACSRGRAWPVAPQTAYVRGRVSGVASQSVQPCGEAVTVRTGCEWHGGSGERADLLRMVESGAGQAGLEAGFLDCTAGGRLGGRRHGRHRGGLLAGATRFSSCSRPQSLTGGSTQQSKGRGGTWNDTAWLACVATVVDLTRRISDGVVGETALLTTVLLRPRTLLVVVREFGRPKAGSDVLTGVLAAQSRRGWLSQVSGLGHVSVSTRSAYGSFGALAGGGYFFSRPRRSDRFYLLWSTALGRGRRLRRQILSPARRRRISALHWRCCRAAAGAYRLLPGWRVASAAPGPRTRAAGKLTHHTPSPLSVSE